MKKLFLVVILIGALASIPNAFSDTNQADLGEEITLKHGDKVVINSDGIIVRFLSVSEDSRCPSDVTCVWKGKASVIVNININGLDLGNYEFSTDGNKSVINVNEYSLKLNGIEPYPESSKSLEKSDYILKFVVSKHSNQKIIDCESFVLQHKIVGGKVINSCKGIQTISVSITINADTDGKIIADIPGTLVYSLGENCRQDDFIVLINGKTAEFNQKFSLDGRILTISFAKGLSRIDVIGSQTLADPMPSSYCGITHGYSSLYLPPKIQYEQGVSLHNIKCNEGLFLIFKKSDNSPSCVASSSKTKLTERNWAALDSRVITNSKKLTPYPGAILGDEHEHAIMVVKIFGEEINFARPNFQLQSKWIHFENENGYTIHRHAKDVSLGFLFKTLNMNVGKDCILTHYGKEFCSNDDFALLFFINGNKVDDLSNYIIKENDRILILYGNESQEKIENYLQEINSKELFPEKKSAPILKYV